MYTNRLLTFSDQFVISCGTISIDVCRQKVLLIYYRDQNVLILPKGRKNRGENLESTAIRETTEETGYSCHLMSHSAPVKAPVPENNAPEHDAGRLHTEPIAVQQWVYSDGVRKFIFWYLGAADSTESPSTLAEDGEKFDAQWYSFEEAVQRASFEEDRKLIEKAIHIVSS
ncbi:hypothetical protein FE257_010141 [Aspergillus nanangensis]|uniref:Nudix hydrolase domain-containing protein n=1 Tax=Aspergillus nanangensis TaxID=2582783 RepID=A0AAD4GTL8_ASPNN|nr:hypothetical protein FE257_010141 [Aspergillus nanangensis]